MCRTVKIVGIIVVVVAVVAIIGINVFLRTGLGSREARARTEVEAEIARIKAAGEPTTPADLRGPAIPDSQNGAVVYERAFEMIEGFGKEYEQAKLGNLISMDPKLRTAAAAAEGETILRKYDGVFQLIEQAEARPECRFEVKWEDGHEALFKYVPRLRNLARLLSLKAVVESRRGQSSSVVGSIETMLRLTEAVKDEPSLTSQLVRVAITSIAVKTVAAVGDEAAISEADARRLYRAAANVDLTKSAAIAIYGERVSTLGFVQYYQANHRLPPVITSIPPGWAKMYIYVDTRYALKEYRRMLADSEKPYRQVASEQGEDIPVPFPFLLASISLPGPRLLLSTRDSGIARLALIQAFAVAQAYRSGHGTFPGTLDEAQESTGLTIPPDPFSGKPLVYKKQGKGFVVYSIGENLVDDGGKDGLPGRDRATDIVIEQDS